MPPKALRVKKQGFGPEPTELCLLTVASFFFRDPLLSPPAIETN